MTNLSAMTLFLWHQSAFLAVTMVGVTLGRLPGLHTAPSTALWIPERLAWLPVFAVTLVLLWAAFHRLERPRGPRGQQPAAVGGEMQQHGSVQAARTCP